MNRRYVVLLLSALLAGCGGMRLIESDVSALSELQTANLTGSGGSYRFERLLSQQAQPQAQAGLEAIAEQAMAKLGMHRAADPAQARYSVMASARTLVFQQGDEGNLWPMGAAHGNAQVAVGIGGQPRILGIMRPMMIVSYVYRSQASLVMREVPGMRVVFEARAAHEGPWPDSPAVYAALFDAALRDFPRPPPGIRRVRIEIPR